jgi:hypothetical protein
MPIFQQADISLSNLIICRALLPYTLHALLVDVDLFSQAQIRSFHRAVQDDYKARLVRLLTLSTVMDWKAETDEEAREEEESSEDESDSDEEGSSADEPSWTAPEHALNGEVEEPDSSQSITKSLVKSGELYIKLLGSWRMPQTDRFSHLGPGSFALDNSSTASLCTVQRQLVGDSLDLQDRGRDAFAP